jgi:hypothetical protein
MEHLFFAFSDINRRNKMTIDLMDDIRRGLEEKRSVVSECCEVEEESPELITEAQTHLQVIDTSLQKLDEGTLDMWRNNNGGALQRMASEPLSRAILFQWAQ